VGTGECISRLLQVVTGNLVGVYEFAGVSALVCAKSSLVCFCLHGMRGTYD